MKLDPASLADAQAYIEQQARSNDVAGQASTPSQEKANTSPALYDEVNQSISLQEYDDQQQSRLDEPDLL
jgi:hypothetical protein